MSTRAAKSGLSRDLQLKLNSKYDEGLAEQCLQWVKDTLHINNTQADFECDGSSDNFLAVMRDGVLLAKLANALIPGSIHTSKYDRPVKLAFKQMELIGLFIEQARAFGVPDEDLFQTVDLYENQNLHQVVITLQSLSRKAKAKGLHGFGPKEAEVNRRSFTEEQLKAGQGVIGLQMGSNKGASQSGITFGKQRMIAD